MAPPVNDYIVIFFTSLSKGHSIKQVLGAGVRLRHLPPVMERRRRELPIRFFASNGAAGAVPSTAKLAAGAVASHSPASRHG